MLRKLFVLAFVGVSLLGVRAYAHHSFASTYLEDQKVTIEADVLQFLYRNPHSFLQLTSKDASGKQITWAVEWGAGAQLGSQGVQRDTLRPPPPHDQHQAPVRWLDVEGYFRLKPGTFD